MMLSPEIKLGPQLLLGGKCCHHCTIPAPHPSSTIKYWLPVHVVVFVDHGRLLIHYPFWCCRLMCTITGSLYSNVWFCFPSQVQHNLFQGCSSASTRLLNDKSLSTEHLEPLYYASAGQADECSDSKAHLLADGSISSDSQTFTPRFYELRHVLPGDDLDKEVMLNLWMTELVLSFKSAFNNET